MARKRLKIKRDYGAIEDWAKSSETRNITRPKDPLMNLKFSICNEFNKYMIRHKMKQKELAEVLNITPNKVSDLANFKLGSVSFDLIFGYLVTLSETDSKMEELLNSFSKNPLLVEEIDEEEIQEDLTKKVDFIEGHDDYSEEFEEYEEDLLLSA